MPPEILLSVAESSVEPTRVVGASGKTWWDRYESLGLRTLTPTARAVITADSQETVQYIVDPLVEEAWPESRVRTGVVVGAVQSGKTASMFAVMARLLDQGADIVVVLAGTRLALWRQTYERFLEQLDGSTPETAPERWRQRVLVPQPHSVLVAETRSSPTEYMSSAGAKVEQALRGKRPIVLIIPKIETHLLAVSRELLARVEKACGATERKLHMIVMDDEADDASVLDASDAKTIPRRIEMLWAGRRHGETAFPVLYASYLAYTATPQANFLQQAHNPLAPRSFAVAVRAPYTSGSASQLSESLTFEEPAGIRRYYCGGEFFYNGFKAGHESAVCQRVAYPSPLDVHDAHEHARRVRAAADQMLLDGLRAYLVAAAIGVMEDVAQGRLSPSALRAGTVAAQRSLVPSPRCMLIHPSARQDLHREETRRLVLLSAGLDPDAPEHPPDADDAALTLDVAGVLSGLLNNPGEWRRWLHAYRATLRALATWPGAAELFLPADSDWEAVSKVIAEEVLPLVRVRIINSDPNSDDRPDFKPIVLEDGFGLRADTFTIFVSGNVMSRGITIDGLLTTVFTRPASEPAADTQMQMQRWFGYRGEHAHLCRLFAFDDQLALFGMYHQHDLAMRSEIRVKMVEGRGASSILVLQGPRSLATAKVPTGRLPLHPGPTPSVKLLEADDQDCASANAELLACLLSEGQWVDVGPSGKPRGKLCVHPVSLLRVSEILEGLQYASYDPAGLESGKYLRWQHLEDQLGLGTDECPLFRPPGRRDSPVELEPQACPYSIAAYFRLWAAALRRPRCDGLYPSDSDGVSWALTQPMMVAPVFYVGVAYGDAGPARSRHLAGLGVRTMVRSHEKGATRMLNTLWGRRSEGGAFHGDQLFDYNYTGLVPPRLLQGGPVWRKRGDPGLLLFHVIRCDDAEFDGVAVGLAIPHGGPEQFAAVPAGR